MFFFLFFLLWNCSIEIFFINYFLGLEMVIPAFFCWYFEYFCLWNVFSYPWYRDFRYDGKFCLLKLSPKSQICRRAINNLIYSEKQFFGFHIYFFAFRFVWFLHKRYFPLLFLFVTRIQKSKSKKKNNKLNLSRGRVAFD